MKVALLTGGGDCPGLNQVIRGVVRVIHNAGASALASSKVGAGPSRGRPCPQGRVHGHDHRQGGDDPRFLTNQPYKKPDDVKKLIATREKLGYDALVAIGGDDTLGVASKLYAEHKFPIIGCPRRSTTT